MRIRAGNESAWYDLSPWSVVTRPDLVPSSHGGKAMYHGLLSPRQAKLTIADWQNVGTEQVRHEEHDQRTAWGLYNCFTEGLKLGGVSDVMERHSGAHDFFRQQFWLPEPAKVVSQA